MKDEVRLQGEDGGESDEDEDFDVSSGSDDDDDDSEVVRDARWSVVCSSSARDGLL